MGLKASWYLVHLRTGPSASGDLMLLGIRCKWGSSVYKASNYGKYAKYGRNDQDDKNAVKTLRFGASKIP